MPRILFLCFIHGFKGNDDTFREFPNDLKREISRQLPDQYIESIVYPTYETKGELAQATQAFLDWLKERVMDVRKAHLERPWPPHDREVGVVLIAHSMGGFVAVDTLILSLNERADADAENKPPFPLIQGILTYDTPYNGLARSMFVYGAFSNYQKVSSIFNVATAIGAAVPASTKSLGTRYTTRSATPRPSPAWKAWQLVAVRTGTVGAIAAGGVAAYMHREAIMKGMKNMRNINKETVAESYRQSMETLGEGLACVNRGNVGHSFAWLSHHFTFVSTLLKQKELSRRLDRMGALKGVGIRNFYTSLGENGYWSGGYFVPERTFCAVPAEDHASHPLFTRYVMQDSEDEAVAHTTMFGLEKNQAYERMTDEAATCVKEWFLSEEDVIDDPKFRDTPPEEIIEGSKIEETLKEQEKLMENDDEENGETLTDDDLQHEPDESLIDIATAASMVPLPDDAEGEPTEGEGVHGGERKTYRQYFSHVALNTGTGAKAWLPSNMPHIPNVGMPSVPQMPSMVSSLGQASMPSLNIFGKKSLNDGAVEKTKGPVVGATVETKGEEAQTGAA